MDDLSESEVELIHDVLGAVKGLLIMLERRLDPESWEDDLAESGGC